MKVWIVEEQHKAEGSGILAVLMQEPSEASVQAIGVARSHYSAEERAKWCSVICDSYEVEE